MLNSVCDYVEGLYKAKDFQAAFDVFQEEAILLGFDGALYTYIPKGLVQSQSNVKPYYQVSDGFCPGYLSHYLDARFDRFDPLIKAVSDGIDEPIDWWGDVCEEYKIQDQSSREVLDVSRSYGIQNGITVPLMCDERGVAGASFISGESSLYSQLVSDNLSAIKLRSQLFHSLVLSNTAYIGEFVRPLLSAFSDRQLRYIAGLVAGKKTSEIARDLGTSVGYLDQTMLKLRRKLSGADEFDVPAISRNQILYYAGLFNILEYGGIEPRTGRRVNKNSE